MVFQLWKKGVAILGGVMMLLSSLLPSAVVFAEEAVETPLVQVVETDADSVVQPSNAEASVAEGSVGALPSEVPAQVQSEASTQAQPEASIQTDSTSALVAEEDVVVPASAPATEPASTPVAEEDVVVPASAPATEPASTPVAEEDVVETKNEGGTAFRGNPTSQTQGTVFFSSK